MKLNPDLSHVVKSPIRSCRCGTAVGKQRTFRQRDDESYEAEVLQWSPDRSVVQMPDECGVHAPFRFHF